MSTVEGSIELLSRAILGEAQAEIEALKGRAQSEADAILQRAQGQAEQRQLEIIERARQEARRLKGQAAATAQLKARTLELEHREQLLQKVFDAAAARLQDAVARKDYGDSVSMLLREALDQLRTQRRSGPRRSGHSNQANESCAGPGHQGFGCRTPDGRRPGEWLGRSGSISGWAPSVRQHAAEPTQPHASHPASRRVSRSHWRKAMSDQVATVTWINGPVIRAKGSRRVGMLELVEVGDERLVGEVIGLEGDTLTAQVYEETSGMRPGAPVFGTGLPLSVELGPGLLTSIFDGVQRPLPVIEARSGSFIGRGMRLTPLYRKRQWKWTPSAKVGEVVSGGAVLGTVPETESLEHRIMVPPGANGTLSWIAPTGEYTLEQPIARAEGRLKGVGDYHAPALARAATAAISLAAGAEHSTDHRSASSGYVLPRGQRWSGRNSGPIRLGQDGHTTQHRQVGGRAHHRLHWLWRARQ